MPKKSNERALRRVLNETVEYRKKVSGGQPFHQMVKNSTVIENPDQLIAVIENSIDYAVSAKRMNDLSTALMLSHNIILSAASFALSIHAAAGANFGELTELLEAEQAQVLAEQQQKKGR